MAAAQVVEPLLEPAGTRTRSRGTTSPAKRMIAARIANEGDQAGASHGVLCEAEPESPAARATIDAAAAATTTRRYCMTATGS